MGDGRILPSRTLKAYNFLIVRMPHVVTFSRNFIGEQFGISMQSNKYYLSYGNVNGFLVSN